MPDLFDALTVIAAKRFAEEGVTRDDVSEAPDAAGHRLATSAGRTAHVEKIHRPARVNDARRWRLLGWTR